MAVEELTGVAETYVLAMAEFAVVNHQNTLLWTSPLGACLGIAIYDPEAHVAGLMHSLLPNSGIDPVRAASRPGMFLDTGLAAMIERACAQNAQRERLRVAVAGGGRILDESTHFNIGKRNHDTLLEELARHGLKIHAEQVGGMVNRTMQLNAATGEVRLKISGEPQTRLLCKL